MNDLLHCDACGLQAITNADGMSGCVGCLAWCSTPEYWNAQVRRELSALEQKYWLTHSVAPIDARDAVRSRYLWLRGNPLHRTVLS